MPHEALARRWRSGHPLHGLLTAEQQLAYDPHQVGHMVSLLQQAVRSNLPNTVVWIGKILFGELAAAGSSDLAKFVLLKDAYKSIGKCYWYNIADGIGEGGGHVLTG